MTQRSSSQQLTLLPAPDVPLQFVLDEATRRRGLRHIAEIRVRLAARQAARTSQGNQSRDAAAA
jgi:hypothetical protein